MEFNPNITIKQEEDLFEVKKENHLELDFDIDVKVENNDICEDWCLENVLEDCQDVVNFDLLKKECLQTCFICCQFFTNIYSLIEHNLIHLRVPLIKRKFYICNECPEFYKNKNDLQTHMSSHFLKKLCKTKSKHICKICKKTLSYKRWWDHMNKLHGQKILKCVDCDKKFKCKSYFKRHMKYVHGDLKPNWRYHSVKVEKVECPICKKIYMNKHALKTHNRNCHSTPHQCKICKSVLKSESYLKAHMLRVHYDDGKVYTCHCGKDFRSPRYLRVHEKNAHSSKAKLAKAIKI